MHDMIIHNDSSSLYWSWIYIYGSISPGLASLLSHTASRDGRSNILFESTTKNLALKGLPKTDVPSWLFLLEKTAIIWSNKSQKYQGVVSTDAFICDHVSLWTVRSVPPSVRLSAHPSVCHTFLTMLLSSYHQEITINIIDVNAKGQSQRSRSQRSKQILP